MRSSSKKKAGTAGRGSDRISRLTRHLSRRLGRDRVKRDPLSRDMYAFDSSPFSAPPDLVVFPETSGETAAVIRAAGEYRVPVMPRGAGTCLSGGAVPVRGGISLSMTRMNRILSIDAFSRTALVEPGVVNQDLQTALEPLGLMFPPDPASFKVSTIGGNVAECAGGIRGARYGVTKNYILGLELVLADGSIVTTGKLSREETLGPDLTGIFNGSEGEFAVMTKILVSLTPVPQSQRTALAAFGDINQAALAVSGIIGQGIIPTALELMDRTMLRAVDDYARIGFPQGAEAVLLLEVDGFTKDLDRQLDLMVRICRENGAQSVDRAKTPAEREALWKARRSGNGALGRIRPAYVVHDVTVPRNQVAPLLTRIRKIGEDYGIIIAQMAHAGDGNAHPHLLFHPDEQGIEHRVHEATAEIFKAALALGGTISGEHGIGLEKKPFMGLQFTEADLGFMKRIKSCLDPDGMFNPGKVLPGPGEKMTLVSPPAPPESREAGILEFIPDNMTIRVRGNTRLKTVQKTAAGINAWLPLDTDTLGEESIADLVARGARGRGAMAWGSLREYIFGMEFVTGAGDRVNTGGHTAKNVAGFDFTRLLWKSGGRFGRILSITLKLSPLPQAFGLLTATFTSAGNLLSAARQVLSAPLSLSALMAENHVPGGTGWTLAAELAGSAALVAAQTDRLAEVIHRTGPDQVRVHETPSGFWRAWERRSRSFPRPLALGAGIRQPMFTCLENRTPLLDRMGDLRVELDLGYPGMRISGDGKGAAPDPDFLVGNFTLTDAATGTGFYLQKSGQTFKSELFQRLYPALAGKGGVQ